MVYPCHRCILLELFVKKQIFQGNDEIHQLEVIWKLMGTPTLEEWPGFSDQPWYELVKPREVIPSRFRTSFTGCVESLRFQVKLDFTNAAVPWLCRKYGLSSGAMDLIESLLLYNPLKRVSASEALAAPYFTSELPGPELPEYVYPV